MIIKEILLKTTSYILISLFMILVIPLNLFPCFVSGFLIHELIMSITPHFERFVGNDRARWIVVSLITIIIVITLSLSLISIIRFLIKELPKNIKIIIEIHKAFYNIKHHIPSYLISFLPENIEELKVQIFNFIEANLIYIQNMGHSLLHGIISLLIGLIIGAIIALSKPVLNNMYLIIELSQRISYLSQAFRNIVFAQIKISLVNTFLTTIMIFTIFPLFGQHLPLKNTLIIITFILGLLPMVGNLISNCMIVISALSISLTAGGAMLIYLILIHKLEYFLNAKIVGNRINAKSWELMLAMLVFDAIFGIEGLIAAPIFYAYIKTELRTHNLI